MDIQLEGGGNKAENTFEWHSGERGKHLIQSISKECINSRKYSRNIQGRNTLWAHRVEIHIEGKY